MENGSSRNKDLELVGLEQMEGLKYFYCPLFGVIYLCILLLSFVIVYVVCINPSLHKPMYILICSLALKGVFGSSSFFPKLLIDLWTSSRTFSHPCSLSQTLFIIVYAFLEILVFSVMAYDRYLAVCHALHYAFLLTNTTVIKLVDMCFRVLFMMVLVSTLLTMRLPLCGTQINNIFCDKMSIFILACKDSINNIYGSVVTVVLLCSMMLISVLSYVRICIVCLRLSKESRHKAQHTMLTHAIHFSLFLLGFIFVFIRHRLGSNNSPISVHIGLSIPSLVFPPLMNHLVYGVRTEVLKFKMVYLIKRWLQFSNVYTKQKM